MVKICHTCVLDENFPGIHFDDEGVCQYCRSAEKKRGDNEQKEKYRNKFDQLIEEFAGKRDYDCIAAFSGGKDSTYMLHLLRTKFRLRILAFSFDNWYQSGAAHRNIRSVIKGMDVDHLSYRPRFDVFKRTIQASITKNFFPITAIARASSRQ